MSKSYLPCNNSMSSFRPESCRQRRLWLNKGDIELLQARSEILEQLIARRRTMEDEHIDMERDAGRLVVQPHKLCLSGIAKLLAEIQCRSSGRVAVVPDKCLLDLRLLDCSKPTPEVAFIFRQMF
jgi:hypothetical protein